MARRTSKGAFNFGVTLNPSPQKLARLFGAKVKGLGDYRDAWRLLAPAMAKGIAQNISSRGGALGEPWPAGDEAYLARKARRGFGRVDLVLTGWMTRHVTSPTAGVLSMTPRALRFGTNVEHARAVQFGTRRGTRGRYFVGWNPSMKTTAEQLLDASLKSKLEDLAKALQQEGQRGG